jgi:hypothetical protein
VHCLVTKLNIFSFSYDTKERDSFNKEAVLEEACHAIAEVSFTGFINSCYNLHVTVNETA